MRTGFHLIEGPTQRSHRNVASSSFGFRPSAFFRVSTLGFQPSYAAFTLVEILIALGILSMVLAAIYSSWTAILRASKVGLEAAAAVQRARIAGGPSRKRWAPCNLLLKTMPTMLSFLKMAARPP
jgi:prepilin-type N-terminal cleavage/methylation domain-containing protein